MVPIVEIRPVGTYLGRNRDNCLQTTLMTRYTLPRLEWNLIREVAVSLGVAFPWLGEWELPLHLLTLFHNCPDLLPHIWGLWSLIYAHRPRRKRSQLRLFRNWKQMCQQKDSFSQITLNHLTLNIRKQIEWLRMLCLKLRFCDGDQLGRRGWIKIDIE